MTDEKLIEMVFGEALVVSTLNENNPLIDDEPSDSSVEKRPSGWENVIKKMKDKKIKNPNALAQAMHKKGFKPKT